MGSKSFVVIVFLVFSSFIYAQETQPVSQGSSDTVTHYKYLSDLTIVGRHSNSDYQQMPEIVGTNIYAGKKSSLIVLANVQGNVTTNTMRQVLAKIPGIHIWESDPSGIQIGIAARGLSPNRSWEFNVRQNGYDIAADPFGYPEAYYNPQLQAVQRIEIVRGQGSLQYGPQFGGMVNYILHNGSEIKKKFEFQTQQTVGSNGLFNTFNAIGGKVKKVHYYAFFDHRNGNGWRDNSRFFTNAGFGTVTYQVTPKAAVTVEVMHSNIKSQQPGGLTDAQFAEDAKQSLRSRNWFNIVWTNPAITLNYQLNNRTQWITKMFATIGDRNSVGFTSAITNNDSINLATGTYNNRVLNVDTYRNYGLESRIISSYSLGNMRNTVAAGMRLYTGSTHRKADGKGTNGSDYDMTVIGKYPRDITFKSLNAAVFAENIFRLSEKTFIIPGVRYEWLQGEASGINGISTAGTEIPLQNIKRSRGFLLAGIGAEHHITSGTEIYANWSEAYRPIQFANLQAPPTTDVVDPDLKDAKGYNIDLGYRGRVKNFLQFDVSAFYLLYRNRVGSITPAGSSYRFVTNVGNSVSRGIESYAEFDFINAFTKRRDAKLAIFSSYSYTAAKYSGNHKDAATKGKRVENAPKHILRTGLHLGFRSLLLTGQVSYADEAYSDANNTATPTSNGQTGLIPSYTVTDLTLSCKFSTSVNLKAGVNNLFDARYFTRRAGGYPGPGALPADGRNFFISIGAKL